MAVHIKFDASGMPQSPVCVLSKRNGEHIGALDTISKIHFCNYLNSPAEFSFTIYKTLNGIQCKYWEEIRDERLLYIPEWEKWFELSVELKENNNCVKTVTAKSLCESELSKLYLYDVEINTENDIARPDYTVSVLYNPNQAEGSILNRLLKDKALHYKILHVDDSIANMQRTFRFDNTSIYDAFQKIADELHCLFIFGRSDNSDGIFRTISVYDLESTCKDCGYRGEFADACPKCGSTNTIEGYGQDTTIFVSAENLAEGITYETDKDSVKNCFKLQSGDTDMDTAIINCNPAGTSYLQYIDERTKEDMSPELVQKLNSYDAKLAHISKDRQFQLDPALVNSYNQLIQKYQIYQPNLQTIQTPVTGYQDLMKLYYDTIDFSGYLRNTLMPPVSIAGTDIQSQAALLTPANLSPVSVENTDYLSLATANSVVLAYAKVYIDTARYKIKVNTSHLSGLIWTGNFTLTSYKDEEETITSNTIRITFNQNYENFIRQKMDKILAKDHYDLSIVGLFEKEIPEFKNELKKYSLSYLQLFHSACQACLDILIEQGISEPNTKLELYHSSEGSLYESLYKPYFNKLTCISQEIQLREQELQIITGASDNHENDSNNAIGNKNDNENNNSNNSNDNDINSNDNSNIAAKGIQTVIADYHASIAEELNFQKHLGEHWKEFCSFRNEDLWKNDNYVSDGLDNAELFQRAREFLDTAEKELIKSATLQHQISATLKNLLVMKDFAPITEYFTVGNWIRLSVDHKVYRLRLIQYEIDFEDMDTLSVTFSDVIQQSGSISDIKSILQQSKSIATSYSSIKHQAEKVEKNDHTIKDWLEKGFDATTTKIVNSAENQSIIYDEHGLLCREYDPLTDTYSPTQLKIINSTLAVTKDAWETASTGVGKFIYFDPKDQQYKTGYGIIADTVVGNIILGKTVGIYNETGNLVFDEEGLEITNGANHFKVNPNSDKMLSVQYDDSEIFSVSKDSAKISGFHMNENAIYSGADSISSKTKGVYIGTDGLNITDGNCSFQVNPSSDTILTIANKTEPVFYVDKNGKLHIKGDGAGLDISANSTVSGLSSRITQNANGIQLKVDKNGIVSSINQSNEAITINANKINLNGIVTANQYFKILPDGSMMAKNGTFSGNLNFDSASISSDGTYESWTSFTPGDLYVMQMTSAELRILKNNNLRFRLANAENGCFISMYDDNPNLVFFNVSGTERKVIINGSFQVSGTKNRIADTENYSQRLLYCYEMASPIFGDIGEGTIDETGSCCIFLDDIFSETIASDMEYQVFLQKEGPGDVWIDSKEPTFFIVKGTPGLKFAWEIKAKQKEYECDRLEKFEHTQNQRTDEASSSEVNTINELESLIKEREELLYETT